MALIYLCKVVFQKSGDNYLGKHHEFHSKHDGIEAHTQEDNQKINLQGQYQ